MSEFPDASLTVLEIQDEVFSMLFERPIRRSVNKIPILVQLRKVRIKHHF